MRKSTSGRRIRHHKTEHLLGTSILPKGELLLKKQAEANQLLDEWISKKANLKNKLRSLESVIRFKNEEVPNLKEIKKLKENLASLSKGSTDLKLDFIPFNHKSHNGKGTKEEQFEQAMNNHDDVVNERRKELSKDYIEKYGEDVDIHLTRILRKFKNTSKPQHIYS